MLTNNLAQWTLFSFIACTELAKNWLQTGTGNYPGSSASHPPITLAADHYDCMWLDGTFDLLHCLASRIIPREKQGNRHATALTTIYSIYISLTFHPLDLAADHHHAAGAAVARRGPEQETEQSRGGDMGPHPHMVTGARVSTCRLTRVLHVLTSTDCHCHRNSSEGLLPSGHLAAAGRLALVRALLLCNLWRWCRCSRKYNVAKLESSTFGANKSGSFTLSCGSFQQC